MTTATTSTLVELAQDVLDKTEAHRNAIAARIVAGNQRSMATSAEMSAIAVEAAAKRALTDAVTASLHATSAFEPTDPTPAPPAPAEPPPAPATP